MNEEIKKSIEEIVKSNDLVIADSNIFEIKLIEEGIPAILYEGENSTNDILPILEEYLDSLNFFNNLVLDYPIYTVDQCIMELREKRNILKNQLDWRKSKSTGGWIKYLVPEYKEVSELFRKRKIKFEQSSKMKHFRELSNEIPYESDRLIHTLSRGVIKPEKEDEQFYNCLFKFFDSFANLRQIRKFKMEDEFSGFGRKKQKKVEYYGTDEHISATAFYKALKDSKDVAVISNDADVYREIREGYRFFISLLNPRFELVKKLKKTNITIYNKPYNENAYRPRLWTKKLREIGRFQVITRNDERFSEEYNQKCIQELKGILEPMIKDREIGLFFAKDEHLLLENKRDGIPACRAKDNFPELKKEKYEIVYPKQNF